jgi:peptidoglycan/LPS O-acetylase OafA/YrhL
MGLVRLLLALAVVCSHARSAVHLIGPVPAVEGFFIISGFYVAMILTEKYADNRAFYFNRALRIFPVYWLVLAITTGVTLLVGANPNLRAALMSPWGWDAKALMIVANLGIFGSDVMMFAFPNPNLEFTSNFYATTPLLYKFHAIPQAWSLPLELLFYALAPFVARKPRRLAALVFGGLAIKALTFAAFGYADPWTYRFFPSEIAYFSVGGLAFHALRRLRGRDWFQRASPWVAAMLIASIVFYPFKPGGAPLADAAFLVLFAAALPFAFTATKTNRIDRFVGDLSYAVYLVHLLPLAFPAVFPALVPDRMVNAALYSVGMAALIQIAFYRPLERVLKRGGGKPAEKTAELPPKGAAEANSPG